MRSTSKDEAGAPARLGRHRLQRDPAGDQRVGVERRHGEVRVPVRLAVAHALHKERILQEAHPPAGAGLEPEQLRGGARYTRRAEQLQHVRRVAPRVEELQERDRAWLGSGLGLGLGLVLASVLGLVLGLRLEIGLGLELGLGVSRNGIAPSGAASSRRRNSLI